MNPKIKQEFSAGAVVYKKLSDNTFLFLLGKHSGYHKWVLPKGMIEKGETEIKTATRETQEEMSVKISISNKNPIHIEKYFYQADLKEKQSSDNNKPFRRVLNYQENGGGGILIHKTVTFFLASYLSGDPKNHGWEMEDAGWFSYQKCLELMSFEGEKKALKKANQILISKSF